MPATTILLARHGETDWNRDNRFQGHADPPLNERGREQARALAEFVAGEALALVYASPLRRAHETAEIVAARLGVELRLHADLKEVDVGSWSGLTRDEVAQRHPHDFARWLAHGHGWADGESYEQLAERVVGGLVDLASTHAGERLLAVTHGGPIRAAMAGARGVSFAEARRSIRIVENCALVQVAVRAGRLMPAA